MCKSKKIIVLIATYVLSLAAVDFTAAEELNLGGGAPTKEEVIRALKPDGGNGEEVSTRSINIRPKHAPTTAAAPAQNAISLEVRFEYDSAKLTGDAIRQLTPVAEALTSGELKSLRFQVEGYTDAKGSEEYNKNLSVKRASAVRDFFVSKHGLSASRIKSSGHGEAGLLDPADPYSAVNRRVRIVATR